MQSKLIRKLYEEDQKDRAGKDWTDTKFLKRLTMNDQKRKAQAEKIYEEVLETGEAEECYRLSFIFQHGNKSEDYLKANALAKRAMDLGHPRALRMVANSYDRWMVHMTNFKLQRYGTQSHWVEELGEYVMYPVELDTTDEERKRFQVEPLAELEERVKRLKKELRR